MSAREELHHLVDQIPEADVLAARRLLHSLMDPVERALLLAPIDDEAETEDERAAVDAARKDPAPDIPFEQVRLSRK